MLFNDKLIFIHIPKTGGMSCSRYLARVLQPTVHVCSEVSLQEVARERVDGLVAQPHIPRHSTLAEALPLIEQVDGRTLQDFDRVVAVIRHPFALEYSFYRHLQKPTVRKRLKGGRPELALAMGPFDEFARKANYHQPGKPQEAFFTLGGEIPPQVELVRMEDISNALPAAVAAYCRPRARQRFPHQTRTSGKNRLRELISDEIREVLYNKHRWMFDQGYYSPDSIVE